MTYAADRHIGRNVLRRVEVVEVDDTGPQQLVTVKGLPGELMLLPYRAQYFGASGNPPPGSDGLALLIGGRPDQAVLIGIEHQDHRPKNIGVGEKVLYNAHGDIIKIFKEEIEVVTKTFRVKADTIILDGEVHLGGEGGQLVHRKGDEDSDGDTAEGSATRVYAV